MGSLLSRSSCSDSKLLCEASLRTRSSRRRCISSPPAWTAVASGATSSVETPSLRRPGVEMVEMGHGSSKVCLKRESKKKPLPKFSGNIKGKVVLGVDFCWPKSVKRGVFETQTPASTLCRETEPSKSGSSCSV